MNHVQTNVYQFVSSAMWSGWPLSADQIREIEQRISQMLVEERGAFSASTKGTHRP